MRALQSHEPLSEWLGAEEAHRQLVGLGAGGVEARTVGRHALPRPVHDLAASGLAAKQQFLSGREP